MEAVVQLSKLGDAGARQSEHVQPILEGANDPAVQFLLLAREENVPDSVLLRSEALPMLRDRPVLRRFPAVG
jgi:hypothetical protein